MKKIFLLFGAAAFACTLHAKTVATFENEAGGIHVAKADTCWQGADVPVAGWNNWLSGEFAFQSYYGGNSGYGDYYAAFTVTNETANTSTGTAEAYRSAKGGAYAGENFAVWNMNYYGGDTVSFDTQLVPGFFVCNTAYAVASMSLGDSYAKKFGKDDWFLLTITGLKDGVAGEAVDFYLAKDGKYVADWTYVDLSALGEINGVVFSMSSSDTGDWGMNTPAYFAMDNFGAELPEGYVAPAMVEFQGTPDAVDNVCNAAKAQKVIRNGQVLILRDGKIYNVTGTAL